ncbi:BGTF surface domain-containing protein [Haloferax namakaokahaiae]|uniref:BGTF surface domain-containing protein n=1 Tax=Haloferax namakaokahaiae TaxID=1748331 RepID=A0ABD5ZGB0_9EURY
MSSAPRVPALLVVVAVILATVWVPAPAGATNVPSASFSQQVVTVERGDVVEIQVSHSESGTLHIGSDDDGYHLTVELTGSGTTTVTMDTYNSTGSPSTYVSGGGNKTLQTGHLRDPIEPSTYLMNVTIGGVERAISKLEVTPREPSPATTYIAPESLADDELTAENVRSAATERTTVARGDLAVIRLDEHGLESALNADNVTGDAASNGIEVSMTQLEEKMNKEEKTFLATPATGTWVVPDFENDVVYVVWDTSELPMDGEREAYEATVRLRGDENDLVEEDTVIGRTKVTLIEQRVEIDVENETIYPWEPPTTNVTGETTLAPGTQLEIRARAPGQPFLKLIQVTVTENETFARSVEFEEDDRGLVFPLWIRQYRDSTEHTMRLYDSNASLTFIDQETNGTYATLDQVNVSVGGFVRIETADEELLGTSDYLEPGSHENVVVEFDRRILTDTEALAIVYMDKERDQNFSMADDPPYRTNGTIDLNSSNGSIVADDALLQLSPDATTPTPTPTPTPTATPTNETTTTMSTTATETPYPVQSRTPLDPSQEGTNAGIPFSPALVVIALLSLGFIARRRR